MCLSSIVFLPVRTSRVPAGCPTCVCFCAGHLEKTQTLQKSPRLRTALQLTTRPRRSAVCPFLVLGQSTEWAVSSQQNVPSQT